MKKLFFAFFVCTPLAVLGQSKAGAEKPQVLFTVSANPTYAPEFTHLYKKNHLKAEDFSEKKVDEYLNLLINFKLKVTEARARGLDTTRAFFKEFNTYKSELKKPYLAEKNEIDRLTLEVYQRLKEEIKASHILINVKPDANPSDTLEAFRKMMSLRDKLVAGASFETVVNESSEDPTAKANGGNLGYFTALQMVYPFEEAVYRLKPGELSQPFRTRFGYHLAKVIDRRPASGEVEVSHIILRKGTGDDLKVKNKTFEIFDQLRGGRPWDELCKEYSDDPATKGQGGRLRPFGVGAMANVPEFEAAAFSLKVPGEISDPFQSAYGWHIIRLEKKIPLATYPELEPSLRRRVTRDDRLRIADEKVFEEKKKKYAFSEDPIAKKWFLSLADSNLLRGKWRFVEAVAEKQRTIFTVRDRKYSVDNLVTFIRREQAPSTLAPGYYMEELYIRFIKECLDEVEETELMKNDEYRNLVKEYREGILLFTIMEKEVWNKASEDTTGLRVFYRENVTKYKAGDRVRARIFVSTDKVFVDEIQRRVQSGDSIKQNDLKKFKSIHPFRNYERGDSKAVDQVPWLGGLHETTVEGTYYLVEINNLVQPGTKSLEEARAQVVSDYQDALEKQWINRLKSKYPVKVNSKGKKMVVTELLKKETKNGN